MGTSPTGDVIEANATSTPAQGQGTTPNREARRKATAKLERAARDAEKAQAKLDAAQEEAQALGIEVPTSDEETTEVTEGEAVPSKPAKAAFAVGRGARKVGKGILDANLRGAGKRVKGLKRFVPVIHIEGRDDSSDEDAAPTE